MNRTQRIAANTLLMLLAAAASIAVALLVTPMQQVSAAGQVIQVGVTAPSLSLSGPGELDLFGQQIPTDVTFTGPVRPRLRLSHITLSQQLAEFTNPNTGKKPVRRLESALVQGWRHYFYWQLVVVAGAAVVLLGAVSGWLRHGWKQTLLLIGVGLIVTEAINLGAIMTTAYTAPAKLSQVHSLQALVGDSPDLATPSSTALVPTGSTVVVIGDSTAAGFGNRPLPQPSAADRACHRSLDSYALDLASANDWQVTNLACSGATIADGVLAPQYIGSQTLPAQMSNPAVAKASTIIVSVGANDVSWSSLLEACAVSSSCDNNIAQAYFQQNLATFSTEYLQLLSQLQLLPNHPNVLINLYYSPFSSSDACLSPVGITSQKLQSMLSLLSALNSTLAAGAKAAAFTTAQPNFTGHGPCSSEPYVQGVKATAPFHPTAAGELAIALADNHALQVTR